MRERDPFGTALSGLRRALESGLAPGQHLPIGDIASALNLSTSPVREALSRLCGEGLIEDRRGQGYFTRTYPLEDIQGLLALERAHVRLAAATTTTLPVAEDDVAVEAWIAGLMKDCSSHPLVESFDRVHQRLEPLRRLHGRTTAEPGMAADRFVEAYYDRWSSAALGLAARIRRIDPTTPEYTANIV